MLCLSACARALQLPVCMCPVRPVLEGKLLSSDPSAGVSTESCDSKYAHLPERKLSALLQVLFQLQAYPIRNLGLLLTRLHASWQLEIRKNPKPGFCQRPHCGYSASSVYQLNQGKRSQGKRSS